MFKKPKAKLKKYLKSVSQNKSQINFIHTNAKCYKKSPEFVGGLEQIGESKCSV